MSKVVQAINVILSHPEYVGEVLRGFQGELFFEYKGKHKWGTRRDVVGTKTDYWLYYYPGEESVPYLANMEESEWQENPPPMVAYSAREIGTPEAVQTFASLYSFLKERVYRVNEALDDIIGDDF